MMAMFERDLENSTEVVLQARKMVHGRSGANAAHRGMARRAAAAPAAPLRPAPSAWAARLAPR